ncbi:MAG: glycoside hydrolase family 99-like domain-containing protein [Flavobacteriales bacterium]|nr:glycoside hydrolase family 99-like domain-containing protein [Flavobacteriales bacterium]
MQKPTYIAFYLPQFHRIEENDRFWGKGFTDWDMVRNAKPLFPGHKQPKFPDLGYYDLLDTEIRQNQAELAREFGIDAFCYWHYYFGNGEMVMDKPLQKMLNDGNPDLPFMLGWVNQDWTANWSGRRGELLIKQTYPGLHDHEEHLRRLLPYFKHANYLKKDGKLYFLIYNPGQIPDLPVMRKIWTDIVLRETGHELEFLGYQRIGNVEGHGNMVKKWLHWNYLFSKSDQFIRHRVMNTLSFPYFVSYRKILGRFSRSIQPGMLPVVYANWDNTPRTKRKSFIFKGFTPELFGQLLKLASVHATREEPDFVFIKSWNEWAEGNVLEPDLEHKTELLEQVRRIGAFMLENRERLG